MSSETGGRFGLVLMALYQLGAAATFGKLTFFSDAHYTWWNWPILLGLNGMCAAIWPVYWPIALLLRWLFGLQI